MPGGPQPRWPRCSVGGPTRDIAMYGGAPKLGAELDKVTTAAAVACSHKTSCKLRLLRYALALLLHSGCHAMTRDNQGCRRESSRTAANYSIDAIPRAAVRKHYRKTLRQPTTSFPLCIWFPVLPPLAPTCICIQQSLLPFVTNEEKAGFVCF